MRFVYLAVVAFCFGLAGYAVRGGEQLRPVVIKAECLPTGEWPPNVEPKPNHCVRERLPALPEQLSVPSDGG